MEATEFLLERQLKLEAESRERGIRRLQKQAEKHGLAYTPVGGLIIKTVGKSLADMVRARVEAAVAGKAGPYNGLIEAFLTQIDPLVAAELGLRVALDHIGRHPDSPFQSVCISTANAILDDIADRALGKDNRAQYAYMQRVLKERGATQRRAELLNDQRARPLGPEDKFRLGAVVIEPLAASALFEKVEVQSKRVKRGKRHSRAIFRLTDGGRVWVSEHIERLAKPVNWPMLSPLRVP